MSSALTSSEASCMVGQGIRFISMRGFRSSGTVDTNVCSTLNAAKAAGISDVNVYLFPCPTCSSSAASQMSTMVSYLLATCPSSFSGKVWLDIEGSQYWSTSYTTNKSWYQSLVDSCATSGVTCGIYSSYYQWESIFGSTSYSYGSNLPLWYAHYDNVENFSDFTAFGGWTVPAIKQYAGTTSYCSASVDMNVAIA